MNDKITLDSKRAIILFIGFLIAELAIYLIFDVISDIFGFKGLTDIKAILPRVLFSFYLIWYLNQQNVNLGISLRLRLVKRNNILPVLLFCICFSYIAIFAKNILNLLIGGHPRLFTINFFDFHSIFTLMGLGLIIPFWEELTNRGLLSGALEPRYGKWTGILITSLVFGFFHYYPIRIYFAFLLGLGMGWIASETGSILPSIIIHMLFNLSNLSEKLVRMGDEIYITRSPFNLESISVIFAVIFLAISIRRLIINRNGESKIDANNSIAA